MRFQPSPRFVAYACALAFSLGVWILAGLFVLGLMAERGGN